MVGVLIGRTEAEMSDRVAAAIEAFGSEADEVDWLAEHKARWITGTPEQAREAVRRYEAAGAERIMLQDFLPWDLDMIDVMGEALVSLDRIARRLVCFAEPRAVRLSPPAALGSAPIDRVVATDRIRVRAAGPRQPLGQELERRRRPEQGRDRRGQARRLRRRAGDRPASAPARRAASRSAARMAAVRRPISRAAASAWRARASRSARPARSARIRTSPVSGPVAGRCPWRNVSRSR